MTIFLIGNEGDSGIYPNVASSPTPDGYASKYLNWNGDQYIGATMVHYIPSGESTLWVHFICGTYDASGSSFGTNPWDFVSIRDINNYVLFGVDLTGGIVQFYAPASSGATAASNLGTEPISDFDNGLVWNTVDIKCTIVGNTLTWKFYVNNALRKIYTYTDAARVWGEMRQVWLRNPENGNNNAFLTNHIHYGDVIIANESTIGWRLATLTPSGSGTHTSWIGDYTAINEAGVDTGTSIGTTAINQKESYTVTSPSVDLSNSVIYAIAINIIGKVGTTGPQNVAPILRINGLDYEETAWSLSNEELTSQPRFYLKNPETNAVWTGADLGTFEIGVVSKT